MWNLLKGAFRWLDPDEAFVLDKRGRVLLLVGSAALGLYGAFHFAYGKQTAGAVVMSIAALQVVIAIFAKSKR